MKTAHTLHSFSSDLSRVEQASSGSDIPPQECFIFLKN